MSKIKIKRAKKLADIGTCPGSASDMMRLIPGAVVDSLTSASLAILLDALWHACQQSKAIASREIVAEGAVWDARQERLRGIAA